MPGSFTFDKKKISLERMSHPCPKCKHHASVQLIRSEKKWTVFNKTISSIMRVRYECSRCSFRDEELPPYSNEMNDIINEGRLLVYYEDKPAHRLSSHPVF